MLPITSTPRALAALRRRLVLCSASAFTRQVLARRGWSPPLLTAWTSGSRSFSLSSGQSCGHAPPDLHPLHLRVSPRDQAAAGARANSPLLSLSSISPSRPAPRGAGQPWRWSKHPRIRPSATEVRPCPARGFGSVTSRCPFTTPLSSPSSAGNGLW